MKTVLIASLSCLMLSGCIVETPDYGHYPAYHGDYVGHASHYYGDDHRYYGDDDHHHGHDHDRD